jgi:hypothetical protein
LLDNNNNNNNNNKRRNNWRVKRGKRARGDKETTASIGSSGVGQKKKDGSMELELAERCIYNRALAQGNTTLGSQYPSHDVWPIRG